MTLANDQESGNARKRLLPLQESDANDIMPAKHPELPLSLRLVYGLNGVTLSLPMTALLYIVNTRAAVPVRYLSAYGAVGFLPCSLKPFFACTSQYCQHQNILLVLLLIASGIFTAVTALVPRDGVVLCFLLAFCRGVTSTWPEFLLGVSLIQEAKRTERYSLAAAHFQSQAATSRNFGSLLATVAAFVLFVHRHFFANGDENELNDTVVTTLLVTSGVLNLLAAMIAWWFQVGDSITDPCASTGVVHDDNISSVELRSQPFSLCQTLFMGNGLVLVIFQLCIIVFAMQGPIESIASEPAWSCLVLLLIAALLLSMCRGPVKWQRIHRVGLFLMARHAIPDSTYLMGSFIYTQLQSTPILLQALSIMTMGMTTLSSWSYGKFFAGYSHGLSLLIVMAATTIGSSLLSLGNLMVVSESSHGDGHHWSFYLVLFLVGAVTTFAGEWQFLPDVIIATATVGEQEELTETIHSDLEDDVSSEEVDSAIVPLLLNEDEESLLVQDPSAQGGRRVDKQYDSTGIQYGTLISCIDFGDQIGSWVMVPLVSALGISRENDWAGLDTLIVLTAGLGCLSVLLLGIVREERSN